MRSIAKFSFRYYLASIALTAAAPWQCHVTKESLIGNPIGNQGMTSHCTNCMKVIGEKHHSNKKTVNISKNNVLICLRFLSRLSQGIHSLTS